MGGNDIKKDDCFTILKYFNYFIVLSGLFKSLYHIAIYISKKNKEEKRKLGKNYMLINTFSLFMNLFFCIYIYFNPCSMYFFIIAMILLLFISVLIYSIGKNI